MFEPFDACSGEFDEAIALLDMGLERIGTARVSTRKRLEEQESLLLGGRPEGLDEATSTSEIERYAVWPAQALGYKLGQLKIVALREEARAALGDAFDIRDFNQTVLDVASTPLPFIEATVRQWISDNSR